MGIFAAAEALIGNDDYNNIDTISGFILQQIGISIDPTAVSWSGYFAAAALSAAGYNIPNGYSVSANWLSYGQPAAAPAVNLVVILPIDATGYAHVGLITKIQTDGSVVVLSGDVNDVVVEKPMSMVGATFRVPVSPSAAALAASSISGQNPQSSVPATIASLAASLLSGGGGSGASGGGASPPSRAGKQTGNVDTPEKNKARAQSGPMPCGSQHADVTGTPGNFKASSTYSPVSRLPTHEPFTGHPVSQSSAVGSMDGSSASGSSGSGAGGSSDSGQSNDRGSATATASGPLPGGNSSNAGGTSGSLDQKAAQVYAGYKAIGYNDAQIAVLMGNATQESNFNTSALNIGDNKRNAPTPIPGLVIRGHQVTLQDSVGIAQWNGQRLLGLANYAKAHGLSPLSVAAQVGYQKQELATTEKAAGNYLSGINSAAQIGAGAANTFGQKYERFAAGQGGPRDRYAQNSLVKIQNGTYAKIAAQQAASAADLAKQGATTAAAATAATAAANASANAAANSQKAVDSLAQQTSASQSGAGSSGAQSPSIIGGGTLNQNKNQPNAPTGNSTDQDAGTNQSGPVGATDNSTSAGGTGSGGSDGSSSGSGSSSSSSSGSSSGTGTSSDTTPGSGGSVSYSGVTVDGKPATDENGQTLPAIVVNH